MRFNKIITLTLLFTFLSFNLNSYSQTTDTPAVVDPPAEHAPVQEAPAQNPQAESAPEVQAPAQAPENPSVESAPATEAPAPIQAPTGNSIIKSNCNKNDCSGCSSSKELSDRLGSIFKACCAASKNKAIGCSSN